MKTVILTEKPSVARDIASVLNISTKKNGYFENDSYQITWAFGHLVELAQPVIYDEKYKSWNLEDLPIFPSKFKLVLKNDAGAKKQYKIIKDLFYKADTIINATDAGREGELIFRYIYNLSGIKKPTKRLWISSMTKEAIKKGFTTLQPGEKYTNLFYAAYARNVSDWVIGLNSTRAFTLINKSSKVLSLGRVQTPTLYMIIKRFLDNKNFKPTDFFVPQISLHHKDISFTAVYKTDQHLSFQEGATILQAIDKATATLTQTKDEVKHTKPPFLLDLTTLQQVCNKSFGYSAEKTLNLLQGLYEKHKIVSYPRTDSRYLTDDMPQTVQNTLENLKTSFNNLSQAITQTQVNEKNKRVFNNNKVADHHAIIPTDNNSLQKIYASLKEDEKNVFNTVADYFIQVFLPDYKYRSLNYFFDVNTHTFTSSGNTPIAKGWKINLLSNTKSATTETAQSLPELPEDFKTSDFTSESIKKTTTAPPLLNEASLLKYMDNVHTFFKEENLDNIKKSGIGTPATRAATIETLKKREYIKLKGKHLLPTELGLLVYDKIKNKPIASPKTTSDLEEYLNDITTGKTSMSEVVTTIKNYTHLLIKDIITDADSNAFSEINNQRNNTNINCPKCNNGKLLKGKKNHYCSNYPDCDFSIFSSNFFGKKLTDKTVKDIIEKGKTSKKLKGFKSKAGKKFDAYLELNKKTYKVELVFK